MTAAPVPLPADLTVGLKRLKLATARAVAPEVLQTAKTPTMGTRRGPPHPGGSRDRRPRCQQPRPAAQGRQLPRAQNLRRP